MNLKNSFVKKCLQLVKVCKTLHNALSRKLIGRTTTTSDSAQRNGLPCYVVAGVAMVSSLHAGPPDTPNIPTIKKCHHDKAPFIYIKHPFGKLNKKKIPSIGEFYGIEKSNPGIGVKFDW
jgi:hypothetical protein